MRFMIEFIQNTLNIYEKLLIIIFSLIIFSQAHSVIVIIEIEWLSTYTHTILHFYLIFIIFIITIILIIINFLNFRYLFSLLLAIFLAHIRIWQILKLICLQKGILIHVFVYFMFLVLSGILCFIYFWVMFLTLSVCLIFL